MPPKLTKKIMWKVENEAYKLFATPSVDGWELLGETSTLKFYNKGPIVVVGIRGAESENDEYKNFQIITSGVLTETDRFKTDLFDLIEFQKLIASPEEYKYYGVAHSFGGAIMDEFINDGLLKSGVSYNPAVDLKKFKDFPLNHRIYMNNDSYYKLFGQYTVNPEVRQNKKAYILTPGHFSQKKYMESERDAHKLSNFKGGGLRGAEK